MVRKDKCRELVYSLQGSSEFTPSWLRSQTQQMAHFSLSPLFLATLELQVITACVFSSHISLLLKCRQAGFSEAGCRRGKCGISTSFSSCSPQKSRSLSKWSRGLHWRQGHWEQIFLTTHPASLKQAFLLIQYVPSQGKQINSEFIF